MELLVRIEHVQAYLLRDQLAMRGIGAHVFNANMQAVVGGVPADAALPQVWLDDERDVARAREILREFLTRPRQPGRVFCRHCREDSPANFELCWSCGASL